uniref:(California timema) hypothetical protein n=1 Tax=Timema californicum TaxID=61474 RepID=A0A7R9J8Q1_TIMCA|nr:unnamed protein product [Timema californicum]
MACEHGTNERPENNTPRVTKLAPSYRQSVSSSKELQKRRDSRPKITKRIIVGEDRKSVWILPLFSSWFATDESGSSQCESVDRRVQCSCGECQSSVYGTGVDRRVQCSCGECRSSVYRTGVDRRVQCSCGACRGSVYGTGVDQRVRLTVWFFLQSGNNTKSRTHNVRKDETGLDYLTNGTSK